MRLWLLCYIIESRPAEYRVTFHADQANRDLAVGTRRHESLSAPGPACVVPHAMQYDNCDINRPQNAATKRQTRTMTVAPALTSSWAIPVNRRGIWRLFLHRYWLCRCRISDFSPRQFETVAVHVVPGIPDAPREGGWPVSSIGRI